MTLCNYLTLTVLSTVGLADDNENTAIALRNDLTSLHNLSHDVPVHAEVCHCVSPADDTPLSRSPSVPTA